MKSLRMFGCLLALALPFSAHSQLPALKTMPSVARPGPGDRACKRPEYPRASLRYEQEGTVTLRYLINKDGAILEGTVVKSSGFAELDEAALVALAKCAFVFPEGKEEPVPVMIQYTWSLK